VDINRDGAVTRAEAKLPSPEFKDDFKHLATKKTQVVIREGVKAFQADLTRAVNRADTLKLVRANSTTCSTSSR
jgi:hypothetical protein